MTTLACASGTTNAGTAALWFPTINLWGSGGQRTIRGSVGFEQLATVGENFEAVFGEAINGTHSNLAASSDFVGFRYNRSSSSGNWEAVTKAAAGSTTTTDTGVAVAATTRYRLKIVVNSALSQVQFYINDVLKATHTTNIPADAIAMASGFGAKKSVGTSPTNMLNVDWFEFTQNVGTR
jgi:hypothetical protein